MYFGNLIKSSSEISPKCDIQFIYIMLLLINILISLTISRLNGFYSCNIFWDTCTLVVQILYPMGVSYRGTFNKLYLQCLTDYKITTEITKLWLRTILYSPCYGYSLQILSILSLSYVFLQFLPSTCIASYICIVCKYICRKQTAYIRM